MEASYLTNDEGERIGVVLSIGEYDGCVRSRTKWRTGSSASRPGNKGGYRTGRGRGHPLGSGHAGNPGR